jgi:hypothetical protein
MSEPDLPVFYGPIYRRTPFSQILDRVFYLLRSNWKSLFNLAAVPTGAMFAFYVLLAAILLFSGVIPHPPQRPDPQKITWLLLPFSALSGLFLVFSFALFEAASSHAALQANRGISVSFREAYGIAGRNAGRYIWLAVLRALLIAIPIFLSWAVILGVAGFLSWRGASLGFTPGALFLIMPLAVLLYLAMLAYAAYMALRLSLVYPACVAEHLTAATALKRSGQLTRGAKGRIFLVLLVIYAISYGIFLIVEAVCLAVGAVGYFAVSAMHIRPTSSWNYLGIAAISACAIAVLFVWVAGVWASYSTALAILYDDQLPRAAAVATEPEIEPV